MLHNQIVKATLLRLIRTDDIQKENRSKLVDLSHRLSEVRSIELTKQMFGKIQLHRNNHIYDFLLRICELLYDNLLPSEKAGAWRFRSFARKREHMAILFESFIRNFYKREAQLVCGDDLVKVGREDIRWKFIALDDAVDVLPKMQTDVCITRKSKKTIIECKYTDDPFSVGRFEGAQKLDSAHLYQLNSYLDNLSDEPINNNCHAILLYPLATRPVKQDYRRSKGQLVSVRTIDLTRDWQTIHDDLLAFVG